jgi:hypothetical protein
MSAWAFEKVVAASSVFFVLISGLILPGARHSFHIKNLLGLRSVPAAAAGDY